MDGLSGRCEGHVVEWHDMLCKFAIWSICYVMMGSLSGSRLLVLHSLWGMQVGSEMWSGF